MGQQPRVAGQLWRWRVQANASCVVQEDAAAAVLIGECGEGPDDMQRMRRVVDAGVFFRSQCLAKGL